MILHQKTTSDQQITEVWSVCVKCFLRRTCFSFFKGWDVKESSLAINVVTVITMDIQLRLVLQNAQVVTTMSAVATFKRFMGNGSRMFAELILTSMILLGYKPRGIFTFLEQVTARARALHPSLTVNIL